MRGGIGSGTRCTGYRDEREGTSTPRSRGHITKRLGEIERWRAALWARLPAKERRRLFGQCRLALVHEQGSAFRRDLHQCLPGEATGLNVTVFPAAHSRERHPECVREVFLREPGTLTPCTNHAGGIGRRHDLLGRGVRVVLPAHETAGLSRHTSFLPDAARQGWHASKCGGVLALMATAPATFNRLGTGGKIAQAGNDPKRDAPLL